MEATSFHSGKPCPCAANPLLTLMATAPVGPSSLAANAAIWPSSRRPRAGVVSYMYNQGELIVAGGFVTTNLARVVKLLATHQPVTQNARMHAHVLLNLTLVYLLCMILLIKTYYAYKPFHTLSRYFQAVSAIVVLYSLRLKS